MANSKFYLVADVIGGIVAHELLDNEEQGVSTHDVFLSMLTDMDAGDVVATWVDLQDPQDAAFFEKLRKNYSVKI
jgi:hypothetical protein